MRSPSDRRRALFRILCRVNQSTGGHYSWPLISTRWHGRWDTGHCQVSLWGYGAIALFLLGPAAAWSAISFALAPKYMRSSAVVLALATGTAVFYLAFHAAVWP